jgi:hypothetical protein
MRGKNLFEERFIPSWKDNIKFHVKIMRYEYN